MAEFARQTRNGVVLQIAAQPGARQTQAVGVTDGCLKVKIAAPPIDGKANSELCRFLARRLNVPKSTVSVTGGAVARRKQVLIAGVALADLKKTLGELVTA